MGPCTMYLVMGIPTKGHIPWIVHCCCQVVSQLGGLVISRFAAATRIKFFKVEFSVHTTS